MFTLPRFSPLDVKFVCHESMLFFRKLSRLPATLVRLRTFRGPYHTLYDSPPTPLTNIFSLGVLQHSLVYQKLILGASRDFPATLLFIKKEVTVLQVVIDLPCKNSR